MCSNWLFGHLGAYSLFLALVWSPTREISGSKQPDAPLYSPASCKPLPAVWCGKGNINWDGRRSDNSSHFESIISLANRMPDTRIRRQKKQRRLLFDSRLMHLVFDSAPASAGLPHLQGRPVERCHVARDTVDASCSQSFSEFSVDSVAWFSPHVCVMWTDWSTVYKSLINMCESAHRVLDGCIKGAAFSVFYHLPLLGT